ncbi:TspO/MBR family protein [Bremerella sp. JC770]|uniref:TspO/MBR family protein n=1 Tax=Bremerella sp. JC770 TaxID=3232137 RepID=UPI0034597A26
MQPATDDPKATPFWQSALGLVGWIVLCFTAAGVGSSFTMPQIETWYAELEKPFFNPPNWVFGPVWSVLYLMMAVAVWLVWKNAGWVNAPHSLGMWCFQLLLNTTWSVLFFGLESPVLAAVEITVLWISILITTIAFWRHDRLAAILMMPYLAWVSYAAALNYTIAALN